MPGSLVEFNISYAFTGITLIAIGVLVLVKSSSSSLHHIFSYYSIAIGFWSFAINIGSSIENPQISLWIIRSSFIGAILIPPLCLHFILKFIGENKKHAIALRLSYSIAFFYLLSLPTSLFISHVTPKPVFKNAMEPGTLFTSFIVLLVLTVIFSLSLLYRYAYIKKHDDVFHYKQSVYLFWASLLAYLVGGTTNFCIAYNVFIPIMHPYGHYAIALYGLTLFYLIFRYRFLEIQVVVKRTVLFAAVITSAFLIYGIVAYLINAKLGSYLGLSSNIATLVSIIIISLSSYPIYRFLQEKTDRFLFQKKYEYQQTINDLAQRIVKVHDFEPLLKLIMQEMMEKFRIKSAYIYIKNQHDEKYQLKASFGPALSINTLSLTSPIVEYLKNHETPLWEGVVNEGKLNNRHDNKKADYALQNLKTLRVQMAVPCIGSEDLIAIFLLGETQSGEPYRKIDVDSFHSLANHVTFSLENAKLYDDLMQSEKLAAVGQLAAGVAHEVTNPLTVIGGQARSLLEEVKDQPGRVTQFVREAIDQSDRAVAITRKLLRFAKPTRGEVEALDPARLLDESLECVYKQTRFQGIKIQRNYPSRSIQLTAHPQQLQEVFINLLLNACQAMPKGGTLTMGVHANGSQEVKVSIQDTGPGIPQADISKIFDPFYTTKKEGTGLGLFVSYKIVQAHGGKLLVKSKPGQGTKFMITLLMRS